MQRSTSAAAQGPAEDPLRVRTDSGRIGRQVGAEELATEARHRVAAGADVQG